MRSIFLTAILSAAAALACSKPEKALGFTGNTRLDYCSWIEKQYLEVTSANIKISTPRVVTFTAKALTEIEEGAISAIDFKLPIWGGPGQQFDLCKDTGVKCPIAKGSTFTATHNLTLKLWPGFSEDKYKVQILLARTSTFPFDFLACLEGPLKISSFPAVAQDDDVTEWPLVKNKEHWEVK